MHNGSCLFGKIQYTISGNLNPIICCHCKRCRKSSGTAFVTSIPISQSDFHVTAGQDLIKTFHHEGLDRAFCSDCGSQLFSIRASTPDIMRVRLGTMDTPVKSKISSHIFTASKAEWYDILDEAPQYAERP